MRYSEIVNPTQEFHPMNLLRTLLLSTALALVLVSATGCIALVAGGAAASGVAYNKNKATSVQARSITDLYSATLAAMRQPELQPQENTKDALTAKVTAYTTDGKEIRVALKKLSGETTEIKVAVGIVGDSHRADQVLEAILDNL